MTKPRQPLTAARIRKERKEYGLLYRLIRSRLGLTQRDMGRLVGCSRDSIMAREQGKRLYSVGELVELKKISGLSNDEWCALLEEIAK